jgi:hypothetical protein
MTRRIIAVAGAAALAMAGTVSAQQVVSGHATTVSGSGQGTVISGSGQHAVTYAGQLPSQPPPAAVAPGAPQQPPTTPPPRMPTPGQAPRLALPPPGEPRGGPQAFSVVLVVGEMEGTQAADTVPAAARKALTDLKDFLPYRNYRLLDSQWTLCCGRGPIFSRLRGVDDQEYELELTPSVAHAGVDGQSVVNVRFVLAEAGGSTPKVSGNMSDARRRSEVQKEIADLEQQRKELLTKYGENFPTVKENRNALEARLHELQTTNAQEAARRVYVEGRGRRQVIDASFRMDVGETVVVGTSRIQGDKALIALLTAVPPKSGSTR